MKKILIISVLAIAMVLVLTACGGNNDTTTTTASTSTTTTTRPSSTAGQTDEGNLGSTSGEGGTGLLEDASDKLSQAMTDMSENMSEALSGESTTR